jgi:hypothetical protein
MPPLPQEFLKALLLLMLCGSPAQQVFQVRARATGKIVAVKVMRK